MKKEKGVGPFLSLDEESLCDYMKRWFLDLWQPSCDHERTA